MNSNPERSVNCCDFRGHETFQLHKPNWHQIYEPVVKMCETAVGGSQTLQSHISYNVFPWSSVKERMEVHSFTADLSEPLSTFDIKEETLVI